MKKLLLTFIVIFALKGNSQVTTILTFSGTTNGDGPESSLYYDGTFLYGTTANGGTNNNGTIFKIKPDGSGYIKLLDLSGITNGRRPGGSLISDGTFLYGMTFYGGVNDSGTIYKIMPDGTNFTKLLDFAGSSNGSCPNGSLYYDGIFLYGMTALGGVNNGGVIFKIKPNGTGYVKLLDFNFPTYGSNPGGSFFYDGVYLYGITPNGGFFGAGTIFKIKPDGSSYTQLSDFSSTDARLPSGSLISDGTFLYGVTTSGGINNEGAIFKIKPDGTSYLKIFDFALTSSGNEPWGSLYYDGTFLYGMTEYGGANSDGVLFKIMPDGTNFIKLLDFAGSLNGSRPYGSLISDDTFLYGTTYTGGTNDSGTVFKFQYSFAGIEQYIISTEQVNIYPNPNNGNFVIEPQNTLYNVCCTVYDVNGRTVLTQTINGRTTIDAGSLNEGVYNVSLQSNEGVVNKRLVIVH